MNGPVAHPVILISDSGATGRALVQSETQAAALAVLGITGVLTLKGNIDASGNPNYPAALAGDLYYVTVAGKVGGASGKSVDIGDAVVAKANNAGGTEASVGTDWFVIEHNLAGALLSANNLSDVANVATARGNLLAAPLESPAFTTLITLTDQGSTFTIRNGAGQSGDFAGAEVQIISTLNGENVLSLKNTNNGGYSALVLRDKDNNALSTYGYGNPGSGPAFAGRVYIELSRIAAHAKDFVFVQTDDLVVSQVIWGIRTTAAAVDSFLPNNNYFKPTATDFMTLSFVTGDIATGVRKYYISHFNDDTLRIMRDGGNGIILDPSGNVTLGGSISIGGGGHITSSGAGGALGTAAFTSAGAYEVPLTFSTGLTRTVNTITVNAAQSISQLTNLTSNGFITTGSSNGTLSITGTSTGGNASTDGGKAAIFLTNGELFATNAILVHGGVAQGDGRVTLYNTANTHYGYVQPPTSLTGERVWKFPDADTFLPILAYSVTFGGFTTARTYTLPDSDQTLLYSGGPGGTPSSLVGTNISGTAASLTAGHVTTNANLTGDVTSSGNATTIATVANVVAGTLAAARGGTGVSNTGTITLAGNLVTTGAFNTTFAQAASITVTLPSTSATMARTDAAQTFTGTQTYSNLLQLVNVDSGEALGANGIRVVTSTANKGAGIQMGNATTGTTNVWQFGAKGASLDFFAGRANVQDNFLMGGTSGAPKTFFCGPNAGATMPAGSWTLMASAGTDATFVPIIAKGAASQSGDLLQVQNSTGTVTSKIDSNNSLTIGGGIIGGVQALSGAGAINLTTTATDYTSTGAAEALTLANGTVGQIKTVTHIVKGTLGTGVLTPTTKSGYTTITFNNAGDSVTLRYCTTAGWAIIGSYGVVIA